MNAFDGLFDCMANHGLLPADGVIPDGEIHRFDAEGDRPGRRNGWYVASEFPRTSATFGSWRTGEKYTWHGERVDARRWGELAERISLDRARREQSRAQAHDEAARRAADMWAKARKPNPSHAYLRGKGIAPHCLRQIGDALVVPMQDAAGELLNLQFIGPTGEKRFLRGGRVRGLFFAVGERTDRIWLCEGVATAVSLADDQGERVVAAFSCGNLQAAGLAIRGAWSPNSIAVMGDDDWRTRGNPGRTAAIEAAKAIGCEWFVPTFPPNRPDWAADFNDSVRLTLTARKGAA